MGAVRYPDKSSGEPSAAASDIEKYKYNALGQATSRADRNGSEHRKRRWPQRPWWQRRHRVKPLRSAFDWTDLRKFPTQMAAALMKGRALPFLGATSTQWKLAKSQNNLEEGLLRLSRTLLPEGLPVLVLAGRGLGRTELAKTCQHLGLPYAIRIKPAQVYGAYIWANLLLAALAAVLRQPEVRLPAALAVPHLGTALRPGSYSTADGNPVAPL